MFMTLEEHQDLQKAFSANCSFQHPLIQSILLRYNVFENVDAQLQKIREIARQQKVGSGYQKQQRIDQQVSSLEQQANHLKRQGTGQISLAQLLDAETFKQFCSNQ